MAATSSGFEFEINTAAFDDWEFIELLAEIEGGNGLKVPAALSKLIGAEGVKALNEHCRGEDGIVKTAAMNTEIGEIMKAAGERNKKKN